ncbi:acetyltransferase [Penicillium taxi]|uniref:acetyltransferase n=1 Tax=Penicillium taxi TaxID=168475 RepID=UPI00254578C2|nr:acetyltransferase [Penicillium taxi]KAJ5885377.1 acetyltransferase [Penicillium taxi]
MEKLNPEELLQLKHMTSDDVPAAVDVFYESFTNLQDIFPDTLKTRQWLHGLFLDDILNKKAMHYLKIEDTKSMNEQGLPRLIAFAKWDYSMPEDRGPRFSPWSEDQSKEACDAFFNKLEKERKRVMGDEVHIYLDLLCTHPDYRQRGAGSALIQFGCKAADEGGLGVYVDASKAGAPLYKKFKFVDKSEPGAGEIASMARHWG